MKNIWEVKISFKTEDKGLMNWQEERIAIKKLIIGAFKDKGISVSVDEIREG